jgi:DNA-binding PadR family transcriptional regulator
MIRRFSLRGIAPCEDKYASVTGVLDRLEAAGYVRRERDPHDRRRVIVALDAERGLRDIVPVFAPVMAAWQAIAEQYTDEQLTLILAFQHQRADDARPPGRTPRRHPQLSPAPPRTTAPG